MTDWFGKGKQTKLDTTEPYLYGKVEKKELNIWKNKIDVEVPEIEEDPRAQSMQARDEDPLAAPAVLNQRLNTLPELERISNTYHITSQDAQIDLSPLTEILIPFTDTQEMDELWEFKTLKNEISTVITNIYGEVKNLDKPDAATQ